MLFSRARYRNQYAVPGTVLDTGDALGGAGCGDSTAGVNRRN